jgi:fructoselysine-6-phosphate deglycase
MLNFDEARFLRIQSGAIDRIGHIQEIVRKCLPSAENLIFLGTGGAAILMEPAVLLLQRRSRFPAFREIAAELTISGSLNLGPNSIVVIPSLSGTTKESLAVLRHCRERGATVISLVGHADAPLATEADHAIVNFAEDDTSSESFYIQSLAIALAIMGERGEISDFSETLGSFRELPAALLDAKRAFEPRAEQIAEEFKDEPYHIITGAGSAWPQAFYYGMCILEEMQWIRTRPVHASDFFHGTLELVEKGVSVLLLKGEDEYRPLAERVENFAPRYTDKFTVIDTAAFELPGVSASTRRLVSPIVLASVLERLSAHLEQKRAHPLTTRRYYKRVDY